MVHVRQAKDVTQFVQDHFVETIGIIIGPASLPRLPRFDRDSIWAAVSTDVNKAASGKRGAIIVRSHGNPDDLVHISEVASLPIVKQNTELKRQLMRL